MSTAEVLIIGAGPAGYAFARSLSTRHKVVIIASAPAGGPGAKAVSGMARSPKLRQPMVRRGVDAWRNSAPGKIDWNAAFSYIGLHGWGGAAQYWGASVGVFECDAITRNGFNPTEFEAAYAKCAKFVPVAGNEDDALRSRYRAFPKSPSPPRSARIKRLDGHHCEGKFVVGAPRVAVRTSGASSCIGCNRCLSGCSHESIWYPRRQDFESLGEHVETLEGLVVELKPHPHSCDVVVRTSTGPATIKAHTVVLACGPLMTFILLAKVLEKPTQARLWSTPSFAFAFWAESEPSNARFGMANATFELQEEGEAALFGNLYDGSSLIGYPDKVFSDWGAIDMAVGLAARRLIFGVGFASSDGSRVTVRQDAGEITFDTSTRSRGEQTARIQQTLRTFGREQGLRLLALRPGAPGIDIHYGGGIPLPFYDPSLAPKGTLAGGLDSVRVVGGANFCYLPPQSPTLSFMASATLVGSSLAH
jgi:ferredoxin